MTEHNDPTLVSPDEEAAEECDGSNRDDVTPPPAEPKDSILVSGGNTRWHGYVEHGVWRPC